MRVLVVDDDSTVASIIAELVSTRYKADCTSDPYEALQRLTTEEYDVLLTDYEMPGMSGLGLASNARRLQNPGLVIIVLTGSTDIGVLHDSPFVDRVLKKPVSWYQIRSVLAEINPRLR